MLDTIFHRCTESEIFDSNSAPASAEYTPTPLRNIFKVLNSDSCLNSKVNYLKAVAIDTPVDLEIWTYSYATSGVTVTHEESVVGLIETK